MEELEEEISALASAAEDERLRAERYLTECDQLEGKAKSLRLEVEEGERMLGMGKGREVLEEKEVLEMEEAEKKMGRAVAEADERARVSNEKVMALTSLLGESERRVAHAEAACERAKEGEEEAKTQLKLLGTSFHPLKLRP